MEITLKYEGPLRGEIEVPPDKSISHRAIILSSIAEGKSRIKNVLLAEDPVRTISAMRNLGINIQIKENKNIEIEGKGKYGLKPPQTIIDCGNSGTTIRLLSGILSAQPFTTILTGDDSLKKRPMKRIAEPLSMMGAKIEASGKEMVPPLKISGGKLRHIEYRSPIASAQVKSAILLAGLYCDGITTVVEPSPSRDHTERMLSAMGVSIISEGLKVSLQGGGELSPLNIEIPGDFSSASFFIAGALIAPKSKVILKNVGINPLRTGLIKVLKRMNGNVQIIENSDNSFEPTATIISEFTENLSSVIVEAEEIPAMIDEIPILAVVATQAKGITTIKGASELRVKESDRIAQIVKGLHQMGAKIEELPDGMRIEGPSKLRGIRFNCNLDHRIAMALSIAGIIAEGKTTIEGIETVGTSYPKFYEHLSNLYAIK